MKKLSIILATLLISVPIFAGNSLPTYADQKVKSINNGYQVIKKTKPMGIHLDDVIGPGSAGEGILNIEYVGLSNIPKFWAETNAYFTSVSLLTAQVTVYADNGVVSIGPKAFNYNTNHVRTDKTKSQTAKGQATGDHYIQRTSSSGVEYASTNIDSKGLFHKLCKPLN